ncbi:MAG TPA: hypothetical protein DCO77_05770 [Nitrospiraceae bacterium]|nr:hypothetical protein [Nitrospiraceae bacterium]
MGKGGITMKSLVRWDPFRIMSRFDPFEELHSVQRDMDRLFNRFLRSDTSPREQRDAWIPAVESYTKEGNLVYKAELPGMDPKDVEVTVTDREVVIKGERTAEKESKEESYIYQEISYGSFERHFPLPEGAKIDALKAKFTKGILEVTVPVPEKLENARKIEIETKGAEQIEGEGAAKKAA